MLPLKPFILFEPKDYSELTDLLASMDEHTKIMAGGTDLIPNLKHGLYDVNRLISLKKMTDLQQIWIKDGQLKLGALVKLNEIARHEPIKKIAKALSSASVQIASPQIRNMGTVGGNICLDTRCLYFNQTEFWRSALGYCLKKDGNCCHVVKTGKRCVAAASNDLATVLLAFKAKLAIYSSQDKYQINIDDFYTANGEKNNILKHGEIVTAVSIDISQNTWSGFYKLRYRNSIDFPLLSTAVTFYLDDNNCMAGGILVINALVAKPKVIDLNEFNGLSYHMTSIEKIALSAYKKCHPQTNVGDDVAWRKDMIAYSVKQAFIDAKIPWNN